MLINKFAVISAYVKQGTGADTDRHNLLIAILRNKNIKFLTTEGVFKNNSESSVLIPNPDLAQMEALRVLFDQDCFLYAENGKGYLSKNGNEQFIGVLNIDNTLKTGDRTRIPSLDITFTFVEA
ncbi:MAG: hypothetical protein Unbinned200contig1002_28 [Prokaryotic dsDNA virus sp.]|jgi:hypothetical protein|nr:hypothetical protein [Flavobacteriaceae bacterium]QDP68327.1 MAG: hypothetical protein Unbinned200contig1002_28 [Prokaryotic dsDNA virus sp.]|tara:strand:- start:914 stop:1285 length:372 start_codon:yes stop_codon:yes gene_type:complete